MPCNSLTLVTLHLPSSCPTSTSPPPLHQAGLSPWIRRKQSVRAAGVVVFIAATRVLAVEPLPAFYIGTVGRWVPGAPQSNTQTMSCTPHPVPLLSDPPVHRSGFTPRSIHRIILQHPPYTDAKLELMRKLRSPSRTQRPLPLTLGYLKWLEVSRLPPLLPLRQDKPHNSAVWRQITATPVSPGPRETIPPPSRMEENTWQKFVCCSGIRGSETDSRMLSLRSQGRAPLTDNHGNILPPESFRRYTAPGITTASRSEETSIPEETELYTAPQLPHKPRKLTLQNNSPVYNEILQKYQELQRGTRSVAPSNSRMSTPRKTTQVTPE
ncbi:testis-expressed protein 52 [Rhinoderma darwinii]|uniref:testis-expressed protein 52 n=1 Tax=Rhinoderma darwinii TaxID=43563 RepID=UPI003F66D2B2